MIGFFLMTDLGLNNIDKESVENQWGQASILAIRIKKNYLSTLLSGLL